METIPKAAEDGVDVGDLGGEVALEEFEGVGAGDRELFAEEALGEDFVHKEEGGGGGA